MGFSVNKSNWTQHFNFHQFMELQWNTFIGHLTCSGFIFYFSSWLFQVINGVQWSLTIVLDPIICWTVSPTQPSCTVSTCSKNFFLNLHILRRSVDAILRLHICNNVTKNNVSPKQSILLITFTEFRAWLAENSGWMIGHFLLFHQKFAWQAL